VRLVFAGTPEVAAVALRAVLDSRHDVVAVLTRPDAPAGRGRHEVQSPVALLAAERGIELLQPASAKDPGLLARVADLAPDCAPVVAYGALIPPALLAVPRWGWVNVHFSLLPAWRGAAPVQHAIKHGDDITGVTTFLLDEGMDTGPVFGTATETVRSTDTSGELLQRLSIVGGRLLVDTLDALEAGTVHAVPQAGSATLAPKVSVEDARIAWTAPSVAVDRLVRSCTPDPGAWTMLGDDRLRVGPVTAVVDVPRLDPGVVSISKREVLVGTATEPVRLSTVQAPGKRAMDAADWARGSRSDGSVEFT
jgi:methionyl-tRNA formyltransferase